MMKQADINRFYREFEQQFIDWAKNEDHIRGAIVVGSRARKTTPADEWSDLDIVIYSSAPQKLIDSEDWVSHFGTPIITFIEPITGGEGFERRVLYDNGLDVDFAIDPFNLVLQTQKHGVTPELVAQLSDIIGRGIRVLVDKEDLFEDFLKDFFAIQLPLPSPPTEHEYLERVNDFWYHAVWAAKKLRRGEFWEAKGGIDSHMKSRCLLPMIEWHTQVTQKGKQDTWFRGRFLERWADPRIVAGLGNTFAHYDEDDLWNKLAGTMNLFRWIALEVAEPLRYTYPKESDSFASGWVEAAYWDRGPND